MNGKWELAPADEIAAYRASEGSDYVVIVANGKNECSGYQMAIRRSMIDIVPPEFSVLRRLHGEVSRPVVTAYRCASTPFRVPVGVDTVVVHHAGGRVELRIRVAGAELAGFTEAVAPAGEPDDDTAPEAIGFSASMSFDEAFEDALGNLPPGALPTNPEYPDVMATVTVLGSGALFGGIAGFHHFYVRIRCEQSV